MTTLYAMFNQDIDISSSRKSSFDQYIRWLLIVYDVRDLRSIHFPKELRGGSDHAESLGTRNEMPNAITSAQSEKKRLVT
jgi:hypothetical protein